MAQPRLMGVSLWLPAEDFSVLPKDDRARVLREANDLLTQRLQEYVGGLRPVAEDSVRFAVDGPHLDTEQGYGYVATIAAEFDPDDLGPLCPAYTTHHSQRQQAGG